MNKRIRKTASLALIRAFPDFITGDVGKGRFGNMLEKLQKESDLQLGFCKKLTKAEKKKIHKKMVDFFNKTGWMDSKKNIRTYMSFLVLLASANQWQKIEQILIDIVEFQERIMPACRLTPCDMAGQRAFDLWGEIC